MLLLRARGALLRRISRRTSIGVVDLTATGKELWVSRLGSISDDFFFCSNTAYDRDESPLTVLLSWFTADTPLISLFFVFGALDLRPTTNFSVWLSRLPSLGQGWMGGYHSRHTLALLRFGPFIFVDIHTIPGGLFLIMREGGGLVFLNREDRGARREEEVAGLDWARISFCFLL